MKLRKSQAGMAPLGIVMLVLAVIMVIGFAGWQVSKNWSSNKKTATQDNSNKNSNKPETVDADEELKKDAQEIAARVEEYAANNNGTYPTSLQDLRDVDSSIDLTKFTYSVSGRRFTVSVKLSDGSVYTFKS